MHWPFGKGSVLLLALLLAACGGGGGGGEGGTGGSGGSGTGGSGGEGGGCGSHLECPDELPVCDGGECRLCTSNEECEGRGVCDTDSGLCVECLADEDCPGELGCLENVCVECTSGAQCTSGICSPIGECQDPLSCAGGPCPQGFVCVQPSRLCWPMCEIFPEEEQTCLEGTDCALSAISRDQVIGACIPETGTGQEGDNCDPNDGGQTCAVALTCSTEPGGMFCRKYCDPLSLEEDKCDEGLECDVVLLGDPNGISAEVGICRPPVRRCEFVEDCEEDEYCDFNICFPKKSEGTKGAGEACENGEECATGSCLTSGVCSGSCGNNDHCAEGTACVELQFDFGGGQSLVAPVCTPVCDTDKDCGPANFCQPTRDATGEGITSICFGRTAGARGAGEECEVHNHCRSGNCIGAATGGGYCAGRCTEHADCGSDRVFCRPNTFQVSEGVFASLGMCGGAPCKSAKECTDGWVCQVQVERADPAVVVTRCEPPRGPGEGGSFCTAGADCASAFCSGFACAEICQEDVECSTGVCRDAIAPFDGVDYTVGTCF